MRTQSVVKKQALIAENFPFYDDMSHTLMKKKSKKILLRFNILVASLYGLKFK